MKIKDICESLNQGLNTAGQKVKFVKDGFPIIQTRNIDNGNINISYKIKFLSKKDWDKYHKMYKPKVGDVFFTNIGTIGKTAVVKNEKNYLIHWNIFRLRPNLSLCTSEYLKLILDYLTSKKYFHKLQKGGTVNFVTKKMISDIEITLPSIAEQKRIVAKLDAAFAKIDKMIKDENNKINYSKQLLIKYLETQIINQNELLSVDKVCEVLDNLRKPITKRFREKGQFPYFGATGIKDYVKDFIFDEKLVLLGEDGAKWDKGERTAFIADGKYWVNNHAHVLRPIKDLILHEWLVYYFYITDLKPWVTGLTVPKLNKEKMLSIKIPTPSIKIQKEKIKRIFQFESSHKELIKLTNKKIDNLKTLKSSILYTELK